MPDQAVDPPLGGWIKLRSCSRPLDRTKLSKNRMAISSIRASFEDPAFNDPHIEPILNAARHVEREFLGPLCCRKIGTGGDAATLALDLIDHRVGLARGAAIEDQTQAQPFPKAKADARIPYDAPVTRGSYPRDWSWSFILH
jgi:hypothetical protein